MTVPKSVYICYIWVMANREMQGLDLWTGFYSYLIEDLLFYKIEPISYIADILNKPIHLL